MRGWMSLFLAVVCIMVNVDTGGAYEKVKFAVLRTPEAHLPGIRRVLITDFEGDEQDLMRDRVRGFLLNEERIHCGGPLNFLKSCEAERTPDWATTKVFDVVEREALDLHVQEILRGTQGLLNPAQVKSLGLLDAADGIICGRIVRLDDGHDEHKTSSKGKRYTTRNVSVSVTLQLNHVERGEVLCTVTKKANKSDSGSQQSSLDGWGVLLEKCFDEISVKFADHLTPHLENKKAELEKLKGKEYEEQAKDAASLAEKGDVDRAYRIYEAIRSAQQYNPKVLYNLGALNEAVGNYDKASALYEQAHKMKRDNDRWKDALHRARVAADDLALWKSFGMGVREHEWPEAGPSDLPKQTVVIVGDEEDQYQVYAEPSETSEPVFPVPGGIEVPKIDATEGWVQIEMFDGSQGWIPKACCK
ncbi:CsgG/HfaB family protein [Candidatus Eisenbacteria bacterium]|uniref:CsgG/HfaB family protein n=1 Tax=Eiseniibacteriota bacterium TaxID=2212470 RepID=A0ABV6YJZ4_UNCEI